MTVDANVSLFQWPTRRVPRDDAAALVKLLREKGVAQAWAGSFEGMLHHDLAATNRRLAEECRRFGDDFLIPFGTVDLHAPAWEADLRQCRETHRMPGIRLYPNYHGYGLDDPQFARFLAVAEEFQLIVAIAVRMEDPRTQHRLMAVPDVDLTPLPALVRRHAELPIVLLNALMSTGPALQAELVQSGRVFVELATLEGVEGISRLMKTVPAERILFGSHAPFFIWDSAEFKLKESELPQPVVERIRRANAAGLLSN